MLLLILLAAVHSVSAVGKVPPLVAEEFVANFIENKFNQNGAGVNHTCAGTYYSSYSQAKVRADCTAVGGISNNASIPSPLGSMFQSSVLDFTQNPPSNLLLSWYNIVQKPTCYSGPGSWIPPFPSTFLRDIGATWGGQVLTETDGLTDTWIFTTPATGGTIFTFYFDAFSNLVRFTFVNLDDPQQGQVGVHHQFYNIVTGNASLIPADIFAVPKGCPADSVVVRTLPKLGAMVPSL